MATTPHQGRAIRDSAVDYGRYREKVLIDKPVSEVNEGDLVTVSVPSGHPWPLQVYPARVIDAKAGPTPKTAIAMVRSLL